MLICFVWCLAWMSPSFLHRTFSIIHSIPFKNKVWMGAFVLSIVLQFCFCAVSLAHGPFRLDSIPWYVYFLGFIWPLVLLPIQEVVKMHDNKEFTRFQKRSKLEFSTKVCDSEQSDYLCSHTLFLYSLACIHPCRSLSFCYIHYYLRNCHSLLIQIHAQTNKLCDMERRIDSGSKCCVIGVSEPCYIRQVARHFLQL